MHGNVLIVEDESSIALLVRRSLEFEGYATECVTTGEHALEVVERAPPDLVILDIGLPGIDGFEVCRHINARGDLPIIMISVRDLEADRVAGLEAGADDYVVKPFSPRELAARAKAVLRRSHRHEQAEEILSVADVSVDVRSTGVTVGDMPVDLTAREFTLLVYLMRHAGTMLSRERLLDAVWGMEFPGGTRTVDVHMGQLRRKLGRPELIETRRGLGYRFVK